MSQLDMLSDPRDAKAVFARELLRAGVIDAPAPSDFWFAYCATPLGLVLLGGAGEPQFIAKNTPTCIREWVNAHAQDYSRWYAHDMPREVLVAADDARRAQRAA